LYHSTLGSRVIKKKKGGRGDGFFTPTLGLVTWLPLLWITPPYIAHCIAG